MENRDCAAICSHLNILLTFTLLAHFMHTGYMSALAVTIHWTGLLDWNTGLDYWTEVVSFFGQGSMILVYFQIFDT